MRSLAGALESVAAAESIEGFVDAKSGVAVDATKTTLIERLPHVLILQLKRFVYDPSGGVRKVFKPISYPINLDIQHRA